jgi:hypothetical protein
VVGLMKKCPAVELCWGAYGDRGFMKKCPAVDFKWDTSQARNKRVTVKCPAVGG